MQSYGCDFPSPCCAVGATQLLAQAAEAELGKARAALQRAGECCGQLAARRDAAQRSYERNAPVLGLAQVCPPGAVRGGAWRLSALHAQAAAANGSNPSVVGYLDVFALLAGVYAEQLASDTASLNGIDYASPDSVAAALGRWGALIDQEAAELGDALESCRI